MVRFSLGLHDRDFTFGLLDVSWATVGDAPKPWQVQECRKCADVSKVLTFDSQSTAGQHDSRQGHTCEHKPGSTVESLPVSLRSYSGMLRLLRIV